MFEEAISKRRTNISKTGICAVCYCWNKHLLNRQCATLMNIFCLSTDFYKEGSVYVNFNKLVFDVIPFSSRKWMVQITPHSASLLSSIWPSPLNPFHSSFSSSATDKTSLFERHYTRFFGAFNLPTQRKISSAEKLTKPIVGQ